MMRSTLACLLAALLAAMSLAACQTASPPRPVVVAPPGVKVPLPRKVFYEIAPNQREFNVSSRGPTTWKYPEGQLMRAAAMEMMRDMFTEVSAAQGPAQRGIVFQLSGSTSINPAVSRYHATALADVFLRTETGDQLIGQYRGTGEAQGRIFSEWPLQEAYAAAFSELSRQMLADPELMKRLQTKAAAIQPPVISLGLDLG